MRELLTSLLSVALLCTTAGAQTAQPMAEAIPEELTLDQAIAMLRERNPLLSSERQREAAAAGELEQARKLPNPAFSLETESFQAIHGDPAARELFLSVQQPILLGGKRGSARSLPGRSFARREAMSGPSSAS